MRYTINSLFILLNKNGENVKYRKLMQYMQKWHIVSIEKNKYTGEIMENDEFGKNAGCWKNEKSMWNDILK